MSEEARQAEANGETTGTFEFRGRTFTVPRNYDDLPVEFFEAVEDGKTVSIIRGALGPKQWAVIRGMGLNMRELGEMDDLIAEAMGFKKPGESSASSA